MKDLENVLITGSAGFIGAALTEKLLANGINVVGIDNLNSYYDVKLKKERLKELDKIAAKKKINWIFHKQDLTEKESFRKTFEQKIHSMSQVQNLNQIVTGPHFFYLELLNSKF